MDTNDIKRIPQEVLDQAHRRLCRQIASQILLAMSETDVSLDQIASRVGVAIGVPRKWLNRLIDGTATDLREMSDMACALGCRWDLRMARDEATMPNPITAIFGDGVRRVVGTGHEGGIVTTANAGAIILELQDRISELESGGQTP